MQYLEHITWGQYLSHILMLSVLYYVAVLLLFFRRDLVGYLPKQFLPAKQNISFAIESKKPAKEVDDLFSLASKAASILKAYIEKNKQPDKKQLLAGLKIQLKSYAVLRYTPFEQALNNHIAATVADEYSFGLDDDELSGVWMG